MMIQPFSPGKTTYCRLLPPIARSFERWKMKKLGRSMRSDHTRIPFLRQVLPPPPGYTYFGQFIMHDLTQDDTPLSEKHPPEPPEIANHRTPFLDLDSVYGNGPFSADRVLYEEDRASFKLGSAHTESRVLFDVPLDEKRKALIADCRNNENLIIRQIHAMFLKLHNQAVKEVCEVVPAADIFETARNRVTLQYQWLVREFLGRVCKDTVFDEIVKQGKRAIDWGNRFAIPVEFAHGVARFGHSMVRPEYDLTKNDHHVPIATIFREAHKRGAIKTELAIDWRRMLATSGKGSNAIDTTIINALFELGPKSIQPFVEHLTWIETLKLPIRTLYRHITMKLPSGEEVQALVAPGAKLSDPALDSDFENENPGYRPFEHLNALDLHGSTPLWYFILLEAEVNEGGGTLGEVGSRMLAEVLEGALRASPCSILKELEQDPTWRPPAWSTLKGPLLIDNLFDVAVALGLAQ
jgi:hypothetical protein